MLIHGKLVEYTTVHLYNTVLFNYCLIIKKNEEDFYKVIWNDLQGKLNSMSTMSIQMMVLNTNPHQKEPQAKAP